MSAKLCQEQPDLISYSYENSQEILTLLIFFLGKSYPALTICIAV